MGVAKDLIGKTVLRDYVIEEYLGSGGYGDVFRAYQIRGREKFYAAIKRIVIPTELEYLDRLSALRNNKMATDSYFRELYTDIISEIALMHHLAGKSANIVAYFQNEIIEYQDPIKFEIFIAMEYLTPFNIYGIEHPLTVREVLEMGIDVSSALEVCHAKGIMHRDIKDNNIFVNEDGVFKLGDFGLAKVLLESSKAYSNVGSMNYKAPEIANPFSKYDKVVDIYSLGIVLYRMFNHGRIPFLPPYPEMYKPADENEALRRRFCGETLPRPQGANKDLAMVILKACAAKPEDRYQTASELKMALQLQMKELTSRELDRLVDIAPEEAARAEKTVAIGFDASEKPAETNHQNNNDHADDNRKIHVSLDWAEKDRIHWEMALKAGTIQSIGDYITEETCPTKAHLDEAWSWLDDHYWNSTISQGKIEDFQWYIGLNLKIKKHEVEAQAVIDQFDGRPKLQDSRKSGSTD